MASNSLHFAGFSFSDLLVVEISEHGAQLCHAARKHGLGILPMGARPSRSGGVHSCPLDMSHSDQVCAFIQLLENLRSRVLCIWISPDASTTSRARDRRLKGLRHGGPKQLRSSAHPAGVPGLSFGHKRRTELSNQAFDAVLQVARWAAQHNIACFVCNPSDSHLWSTPAFKAASDCLSFHFSFHACMHGGTLPKRTTVYASHNILQSLSLSCDQHHHHDSWQPKVLDGQLRRRTRADFALPGLFLERAVSCLLLLARAEGAAHVDSLPVQLLDPCPAASRLVLGALPRSRALKPLVPEFGRYIKVRCRPSDGSLAAFMRGLPKGSKIPSRFLSGVLCSGDNPGFPSYLDTVDLTSQAQPENFAIDDVCFGPLDASLAGVGLPFHKGCKAECISDRLLQKGRVTKRDITLLLDALPSDQKFAANRGVCVDSTKTWTSGVFHFSGEAGLRTNFSAYPRTTALLTALVRAVFPGSLFSSVGLFKNLKTSPHRDINNTPGVPNLLVPCSDFLRGSVKVQPDDSHDSEISLDVCRRPAKLDASRIHFTEDWDGDRILLVAFHVKGSELMPRTDLQRCLDLGFVVVPIAAGPPVTSALSAGDVETLFLGIPHSPEAFTQKAVLAGHPMDMDRYVSPAVDRAVRANFCDPPQQVAQRRNHILQRWEARAAALQGAEDLANSGRPDHLQGLLRGKRLLLWREILQEIGYPDVAIIDEVEQGLPLTGWMAQSGVFPLMLARRPCLCRRSSP